MRGYLTSDEGVFFRKWTAELFAEEMGYIEDITEKWAELVKWAENIDSQVAALSEEEIEIVSILKMDKFRDYSDEGLATVISKMRFKEKSTGLTFTFGDMLDINAENARSISKKITRYTKEAEAGKTVAFKIDPSWGTNVKWSFRAKVEKALNPNNDKTIYEFIEEKRTEVEEKTEKLAQEMPENASKWDQALGVVSFSKWIFDAVLEGMNAYEQVAEYSNLSFYWYISISCSKNKRKPRSNHMSLPQG